MTVEEAIEVLDMFLDKQCDLERTAFAYDQNTIWDAVSMAKGALENRNQPMLVLSPDLSPEQVNDIFDKFASSQQTKPNDYCKDCKHCEEHYYHGDDSYVYYCQYWKSFTQPHDHCAQWGK